MVIAVVNAYAACRAVMCVARMLLSPDDRRLRLWRLDDDGARFVIVWLRRLVVVAIFGDAHRRGRAAARPRPERA